MKTGILFWFLFLFTNLVHAQVLTVQDEITHQPLALVTLRSHNPAITTVTDAKGQVDISAFAQADSIFIRFVGYKTEVYTYQQLTKAGSKLFLKEDNISLDAVVVSSTRWQQDKRDVPARIISITPEEVALQNPQTTADLLGQSGEVYIQKSQLGGGSPMIRGFATNRVLLTIDGIRMNTAIFRSGNLQNVISLDPFATERTEILFGPGSVTHGSDAIAGVMSFYTLSPTFSDKEKSFIKGTAATRWSSANSEKTAHFDVNVGFAKWAFVTSATYTDYDDLKMGSDGPFDYLRPEYVETTNGQDRSVANADPRLQVNTGYNQLNLMQKVRFAPNEKLDINYGFHYSTTSDYARYDRLIRYKNKNLQAAEWYYGPQEWMMNNLTINQSAPTTLYDKLSIKLAHQFFRESRHNRDYAKPIRYNRTEKVNAYSVNLDFEKALTEKHLISYGAEAIFNSVNSTGEDVDILTNEVVPGPPRYPDGSEWHSYAAFITHRYKASEKISFQSGIRYNHFLLDATFDKTFYPFPFTNAHINAGAVTGSAGFVYSPDISWQLSTNLSTGFRSPNIDDIGKIFDSTPGMVIIPNPELSSEYVYNADLGIAKTFGDFLKLDATAFYAYLDDALVRRDFKFNGQDSILYAGEQSKVQAIQNAANARVWGVQAGVEIKLVYGFNLSSRFSYQKGKEELEDGSTAPLRHAAPYFGATHLTYTKNRFKADLYATYNGKLTNARLAPEEQDKAYLYARDANGKPFSPSWATLNLKTLYRITDYLVATAGLENITDKRYKPYSSGIAAPGRNFIFSLRATF